MTPQGDAHERDPHDRGAIVNGTGLLPGPSGGGFGRGRVKRLVSHSTHYVYLLSYAYHGLSWLGHGMAM
jgi:hypothetical protein